MLRTVYACSARIVSVSSNICCTCADICNDEGDMHKRLICCAKFKSTTCKNNKNIEIDSRTVRAFFKIKHKHVQHAQIKRFETVETGMQKCKRY